MQQFSSKINIKKFTLISLLLIVPFIGFLLLALYSQYGDGINTFFEKALSSMPEALAKSIAFSISILFLFSIFLLCCLSSFLCGKIISKENKYSYPIKIFMSVFWFIGMFIIFIILCSNHIITDGAYLTGILFGCTYLLLMIKAIIDTIRFIVNIIKKKTNKTTI